MTRALKPGLLLAGAAATALALAWWWLTFGDLTQASTLSITEAGACLVRGSSICSLAAALCTTRHAFLIAAYNAGAFWLALGLVATGLVVQGRSGSAPA